MECIVENLNPQLIVLGATINGAGQFNKAFYTLLNI